MPINPQDFIARWQKSDGAERANYQGFLLELCDLLGVERPEPSIGIEDFNTYVFEKSIEIRNPDGTTSRGFIDLYKRNHFVLEAKQGSKPFTVQGDDRSNLILVSPSERPQRRRGTAIRGTHGWDEAMRRAYYQAEDYAKALPEWPPFIVTVDVGHSIELYADFSLTGKAYVPFPDPRTASASNSSTHGSPSPRCTTSSKSSAPSTRHPPLPLSFPKGICV